MALSSGVGVMFCTQQSLSILKPSTPILGLSTTRFIWLASLSMPVSHLEKSACDRRFCAILKDSAGQSFLAAVSCSGRNPTIPGRRTVPTDTGLGESARKTILSMPVGYREGWRYLSHCDE